MQRASRFFACMTLVGISCWAAAALFAAAPPSNNSKAAPEQGRATGTRAPSARDYRGQSPAPAMTYNELVEQARRAFDRGQYDVAESLARQALSKRRPGPLRRLLAKDSPQKLLRDLDAIKANKKAAADRAWAEQERAEQAGDSFYATLGQAQGGDAAQKQAVAALLQQAQAQLQYGNSQEAYRLAMQAKSYNIRYAPGEQTPDDVLAAIAGLQRRDTIGMPELVNPLAGEAAVAGAPDAGPIAPQGSGLPAIPSSGFNGIPTPAAQPRQQQFSAVGQVPAQSAAAYAAPPRSATVPSSGPAAGVSSTEVPPQPPARQDDPAELLKQARRAMAQGEFDRARSLAQQAALQRYAPASPRADSPDTVLHQVDAYRRLVTEGKSGIDRERILREQHDWLLELAARLRDQGDLELAASIAKQGVDLGVPAADPGAMTAGRMLAEIERQIAARHGAAPQSAVQQSAYQATPDTSYEAPVQQAGPLPAQPAPAAAPHSTAAQPAPQSSTAQSWESQAPDYLTQEQPHAAPSAAERADAAREEVDQSDAHRLYEQGVLAMRQGRRQEAMAHFQRALQSDSLEPQLRQRIQDHLTGLYAQATRREQGPVRQAAQQDPLGETPGTGQLRADRMEAEATQALLEATRLQAEKPDEALATLNRAKTQLTAAGREHPRLLQLLRRVNERIAEIEAYKKQNAPLLELREQNQVTEEQIKRDQEAKIAVQEELAKLVDKFNQLMDERRFAEAKQVAEKAAAIAPREPVTQTLMERAEIEANYETARDVERQAQESFVRTLNDADRSRIVPVSDQNPMVFGPTWEDIIKRRRPGDDRYSTRTEAEQEIEAALRRKVTLKYDGTPLLSVLDDLKNQAGVNLVIDQEALELENVDPSTPVHVDVDGIMLKSALRLILEEVHLIYVIRDEVLKITNESRGRGELIPVVYPVGDLVLPIPNFVSGGPPLGTVLKQAMLGANSPLAGGPLAVGRPMTNGPTDVPMVAQNVLAQLGGAGGAGGGAMPASGPAAWDYASQAGYGAMGEALSGAGGAANADFDSLMELIRETIEPDSWDDVGGPGSMKPFGLNLSLIISQTEEVHDRIASLLEQLRRLLDLQLAVEVRFVTLTDNFFERIGIDFDFDIDDDQDKPFQVFGQPDPNFTPVYSTPSTQDPEADNPGRNVQDRDHLNGVAVGQSSPGIFSVDLDIPFRQNSFNLGVPTFGGFTADAGAEMGFALLSDIEAYFFINAAQADRRTNIVQAPKVVMFNGQTGFVVDITQRPFLVSVVPLIGAGSVGFTPLIAQIPSGAIVQVQGIISADRRYVRLTVVPFFIQLGEVFTFTTNLGAVGGGGGLIGGGGNAAVVPVTLQLPNIAQTFVITTVNVPDGGTVLLGGVKRVNEGRTEAGVPVLNKLPYVNRLFKNVGTGRETQSLMLMVTPRIIIGEEEEQLLGI